MILFPIMTGKYVLKMNNDALIVLPVVVNVALYDLAYHLTYYDKQEINFNSRAILGENLFEKMHISKITYTVIWVLETGFVCLCVIALLDEALW